MSTKFSTSLLALAAIILAGAPIRGDLIRYKADEDPDSSQTASPAAEPATDFNLRKFNLGRVKLSDHLGKVVLINFWATWCPPCVKEIPDFVALADEYGEKGLIILGINLDKNPQQVLPGFIRKYKINYPVLLDDGKVAGAYGGITAIPTSFLVDREGNIRQKYVGARSRRVFENDIKKLL